ncbi:MAG TPA: glycosyl hydrolase [Gaiellaceae bacterium]|jgi:hypothetical protein
MRLRVVIVAAVALAVAGLAATAQPAGASRYLRIGIYDEAQTLYGPIPQTYTLLRTLHVQEIRENLYWGGPYGVATKRPRNAKNPNDPAYDWALYDRTVEYAKQYGIRVLFSIYATPRWESGRISKNVAPKNPIDLRNFAYAAAKRYSGKFAGPDGSVLPAVKEWAAWNEPNNPIFLSPQYKKTAGGKYVIASARSYALICNAVYNGVHSTLIGSERVACGDTAPRGNNNPRSIRPSISPIAFLRAVKKAGLRTFDAWAHHPYPSGPSDTPTSKPVGARGAPATAVTLGNLGDLIKVLTQLYGNKRVWITEYGYQTNPPDKLVGVSYAKQARYLKEAFAIARKNPRIDMMLWFMLKDDPDLGGWQSGLMTITGKKKPSFAAFEKLTS